MVLQVGNYTERSAGRKGSGGESWRARRRPQGLCRGGRFEAAWLVLDLYRLGPELACDTGNEVSLSVASSGDSRSRQRPI